MRRFDEDFRVLDSASLAYCLQETHTDGVWPEEFARAIVNYELVRGENYLAGRAGRRRLPGLLELDPPPAFDLVVDEAHHLAQRHAIPMASAQRATSWPTATSRTSPNEKKRSTGS